MSQPWHRKLKILSPRTDYDACSLTTFRVYFSSKNTKENDKNRTKKRIFVYKILGFQNCVLAENHPYTPDPAPSDYYLFRSLQNSLKGKTFNEDEAVKSHLVQFFVDKDQKFYERGIMQFLETQQKVIEQNGKYIID